jgi:mono/diheme cytochrome c family protein
MGIVIRGSRGAVLAMVLAAMPPHPAAAQSVGEPEAGQRLAATWCANCHLIGPDARGSARDGAPSFAAVAAVPSTTALSLRVFLQTPHRQMPDYSLSRQQTDDVIAYILSLRVP